MLRVNGEASSSVIFLCTTLTTASRGHFVNFNLNSTSKVSILINFQFLKNSGFIFN